MSAANNFADLQPGGVGGPPLPLPPRHRRCRRGRSTRRRPPSHAFSSEPATTDGGSSFGLSDSDAQSSARLDSSVAGDECGSSGIFSYNHSRMESSSDEIDLESGELEMKVHSSSAKNDKQCRICHLNFGVGGRDQTEDDDSGGGSIELGCNCKGDLGAAHKQCAETWFKIKGNMTCEICGATAQNVIAETANELNPTTIETEEAAAVPVVVATQPRNFWQGRRIMNILLGCMVFAFIISWLFHFNVLP